MAHVTEPARRMVADPAGRAAASVRVGIFAPSGLLEQDPDTAHAFLVQAEQAGIDHVCCGDHVSFVAGLGFDGLVQATAPAEPVPIIVGGRRRDGSAGGRPRLPGAGDGGLLPPPVRTLRTLLPLRHHRGRRRVPRPYAAAGCTEFNLIPQVPDHDHAIAGTAAVKRLLAPV